MIIYGKNTVKEAILAKRTVYIIYKDKKASDRAIDNLIEENKIKVKLTDKHELNLMTHDGLHQGIVAEVQDYKTYDIEEIFDEEIKRVVILDKIEDPHNFGAIIRTAEAVKMDYIIIQSKGQAQISPVVAKIASGALEHVKIVVVQNLNNAVSKMKENGFWIIGSSLDGAEEFTDIDPKLNYGVIVGNEGVGISYQLKQNCDFMVKIPMIGQVNSLNVSVAAALLMYKLKKLY